MKDTLMSNKSLGYLEAKIEELHADIKEIKLEVASLKEDFIRRQAIYKIALWFVGALAAAIGWIAQYFINR